MERRKTITLLVKENHTQFSPMGSLEVDISYILSWLLDRGFSVTFNYTLASITETVPIGRVPDGLESFIDRLALPQP